MAEREASGDAAKLRAGLRLAGALMLPLAALGLQWILWPWIKPFVWFLFYPAVFFSARLGGYRGGLISTVFSAVFVWYFFLPSQLSWQLENPSNLWSVVIFLLVGYLVSGIQAQLERANEARQTALEQSKSAQAELAKANAQLRKLTISLEDRVAERTAALRESHERLKKILEVETVGMMFWDLNSGCLVDANDAFLKLMGYSRQDVESRTLTRQKLTPPEHLEANAAEVGKFMATGRVGPYEKEYIRKDGTRQWLVFAGSALDHDTCVEFCVDISDRKSAETALRETEERLRFALETGHTGAWDLDLADHSAFRSLEHDRIFGYGELLPAWTYEMFLEHVLPEERAWVNERFQRAIETRSDWDFECRIRRADGETRWIRAAGRHRLDAGGKARRMAGIVQDITARKRAEEAVRASEERLQFVVQGSQLGLWDWNIVTGEVQRNERWAEMLGYTLEEIQLTVPQWSDLIHPDDRAAALQSIDDHLQGRTAGHASEYRMRTKSGDYRWILDRARIMARDEQGRPLRMSGTHTDIHARKQTEEALRKSEARFRALVERAPEGIFIQTRQRFAYVNAALMRLLGATTPEQLLGEMVESRIHPDYQALARERIRQLNDLRRPQSPADQVFVRLDGEPRDVSVSGVPFEFQGEPGALVFVRDVTERKQAERALQRTHSTLVEAQKIAHLGSFEYVAATRTTVWSEEEYRIYGLDPSGPSPAYDVMLARCIHPDDAARLHATFTKAMQNRSVYELEHQIVRPDGSVRWVYDLAYPYFDEQGELVRYVGTTLDITERKQAEEALRASENEFRSLAEAMPQIVWATRADGWNIYFNRQWTEYTGLTLEESHGHGWNTPFHPEDQQRAWDAWQRATKHRDTYSLECRLRRADGVYRWWLIRGVPYCNEQGEILKWFGTCTDIDDMRQTTDEIRHLNESLEQRVRERTVQLEAVNQELETFSYSVSHDLRAPLRHVQGFIGMLEREAGDGLSERARHLLQTITGASQEMAVLIDDLLAFSRMGRHELQESRVPLSELAQEVQRSLGPATAGRNITWNIGTLPAVRGDPAMLRQVLVNLLDNAVKYTRRRDLAEIEVGSAGAEDGRVILYVRDNGVGFDPQYAHKLFGVFQRLHSTSEFEGTGIGLANVRRIIARHGGRTWAESQPDQGATFYFTIRADPTPEPTHE